MKRFIDLATTYRPNEGSKALTLIISILLVALAYMVISQSPTPKMVSNSQDFEIPYHPDEGLWIASGKHYFQKFFIDRDYSAATWEDRKFGSFGPPNPVLGKYIYGGWLFFTGTVDRETDIPGYTLNGPSDWLNLAQTRPPLDILYQARVPARWIGAFCVALLFLIVRSMTRSWLLGCMASLFFILQPQVFGQSQKVMMDIPVLFFSLLTLYAGIILIRGVFGSSQKSFCLRLILIGLIFSLALQVKLNSLLVLFVIAAWIMLELLFHKRIALQPFNTFIKRAVKVATNRKILGWLTIGGLVMGLTIIFIFVTLNPFLYRKPVQHAAEMLMFGKTVAEEWEVPEETRNNTLLKRWKSFINVGITRSSVMKHWLGLPPLMDKGLVVVGIIFGFMVVFSSQNEPGVRQGYIFLGVWTAIIALGLLAWVPFRWARWYLPMAPLWAVLESLGLFGCISILTGSLSWIQKPAA